MAIYTKMFENLRIRMLEYRIPALIGRLYQIDRYLKNDREIARPKTEEVTIYIYDSATRKRYTIKETVHHNSNPGKLIIINEIIHGWE